MNRRAFLSLAALAGATLAVVGPALAGKAAVFTGLVPGVGVGGYDAVAYFAEGKARAGDPAISTRYHGVTYRFVSKAHRDLFKADPEKYLPQYGGYCAYAVANGATAKGEPEDWTVHGGKLYLNFSDEVRTVWRQDIPGYVSSANKNWPGVLK